jgi:hypothetical protein
VLVDAPDHAEVAQALRREQNRILMRKARQRMTPEQRDQLRARDRERKMAATPEQRQRRRENDRQHSGNLHSPFWGVDGEGAGTDDKGRQHYILMAASGPGADEHRVKHRDGAPLSLEDGLEFLLSLPRDAILVGFGWGYDGNQLLRLIRRVKTLDRILHPKQGQYGPLSTFCGEYAITWQPWQSFSVSRIDRSGEKPVADWKTTRIVYEVYSFFQSKFITAVEDWNIGSEQERAFVAQMKDQRGQFDGLSPEMIDYCKLECRWLALLMSDFREKCIAADIVPERWGGPGWIAASVLKKYGIPKRPQTAGEAARDGARRAPTETRVSVGTRRPQLRRPERDPELEIAASNAFYGGRFEVSRIGHIPGPVYAYDLNSGYPAAMCGAVGVSERSVERRSVGNNGLPCPLHTRWQHRPNARQLPKNDLYLAKVTFEHEFPGPWRGLPFRRKNGAVYWPNQGTGWYWSCEIEATRNCLHAKVSVRDLWVAERTCDCRPYDFVPALYKMRNQLGSETQGYPLKLALNSLYGKLAQRSGRGPYHDTVAAGLITAITRARLIEAFGRDPEAVVMLATDEIISTRPMSLDIGKGLGQWKHKTRQDLFIVQPGVYWCPAELAEGGEPKSRGVKRSVIRDAAPQFVRVWDDWIAKVRERLCRPFEPVGAAVLPALQAGRVDASNLAAVLQDRDFIPKVRFIVPDVFHGCNLAIARRKFSLAGAWKDVPRNIGFDWSTKRDPAWKVGFAKDGSDSLTTMPLSQSKFDESQGYEPANFDWSVEIADDEGRSVMIDDDDLLFEAMPDHVSFLPHEE